MWTLQRQIIEETGARPSIEPAQEVAERVRFLVDYLGVTGTKGYVLGISGGVDSTTASRLAQLAVERVRADGGDATFVAVRLPYRVQKDEKDARAALDFIDADRVVTLDGAPGVDGLVEAFEDALDQPMTDFTKGNAKARPGFE